MSPFQSSRIDPISLQHFANGFKFDLLRDDLIHPLVSGNKWRKLKYIIHHLLDNRYKTLVTFGGAYSNHLVATAFAGRHFGLQTVGFVRGDEVRETNNYENICMENGMRLIHVSREEFRDKSSLFERHFSNDPSAFFVSEGGDHPLALPSCAEILDELNTDYDYIILSMGTGTTMEGIVAEIEKRQKATQVIGISSLKNNFDLDKKLSKYHQRNYRIYHDYHRGKYAKSDQELIKFILQFYEDTGIQLDTVYTGKMMLALQDLILKGEIRQGSKVLAIHTGGYYHR